MVVATALAVHGVEAEVLWLALRVVRVDVGAVVIRRAARLSRKALTAALVILLVMAIALDEVDEDKEMKVFID